MNKTRARGRKKKTTGRFFALIAVVAICAVLVVVFTRNRGSDPATPEANTPASAQDNSGTENGEEDWGDTGGVASISDLIGTEDGELEPVTEDNLIDISKEDLSVNPNLDPIWKNILLLGSDARDITKPFRTDTMMILSINTQDGRVKLVTIMRDMYVEVTVNKNGEKRWEKINAASYYGGGKNGPYAAMRTVNECFGMNITDYILVNFIGAQDAIQILGGVEMNVTEKEKDEVNRNMKEQARMMGITFEEWSSKPDTYLLNMYGENIHLNGMQAVAYARIRSVGDGDFDRTKRQQKLMETLFQKARGESITTLMKVAGSVMKCVDTNMALPTLIEYGTKAMNSDISSITTGSIPLKDTYVNTIRNIRGTDVSALYDVQLEPNVTRLYTFIYNE